MLLETNYSNIYVNSESESSSKAEKFKSSVLDALQQIYSTPSGRALINSIQNHGPEKNLIISELSSGEQPSTQAVLTRRQLESYPFSSFSANLCQAIVLSKSEGCGAIINWSKDRSSVILHRDGVPKKIGKQSGDKVSVLAHELVHVRHIMDGTSMAHDGDRYDPSSRAGQEESRAVGIGSYAYMRTGEPSENSVRAELGLPQRIQYQKR